MSLGGVAGSWSRIKRRGLKGAYDVIEGNSSDTVFLDEGSERIHVGVVDVKKEQKELAEEGVDGLVFRSELEQVRPASHDELSELGT
jgi:hypothetical protein